MWMINIYVGDGESNELSGASRIGTRAVHAGFTVVYQDIIIGHALIEVVQLYRLAPLHVIVLCPTLAVVATREAGRSKRGYQDGSAVADFDRVLHTETPHLGFWLESSTLTVAETVDSILAHLPDAQVHRPDTA